MNVCVCIYVRIYMYVYIYMIAYILAQRIGGKKKEYTKKEYTIYTKKNMHVYVHIHDSIHACTAHGGQKKVGAKCGVEKKQIARKKS